MIYYLLVHMMAEKAIITGIYISSAMKLSTFETIPMSQMMHVSVYIKPLDPNSMK